MSQGCPPAASWGHDLGTGRLLPRPRSHAVPVQGSACSGDSAGRDEGAASPGHHAGTDSTPRASLTWCRAAWEAGCGEKKERKRGFTKGTAGLALLYALSMLPGEVRCQSPAWLPTEMGHKTPMFLHHPALGQLQPVWLSTPTPRPLCPGSPEGRSQWVSEHRVPEDPQRGCARCPAAPWGALSDISCRYHGSMVLGPGTEAAPGRWRALQCRPFGWGPCPVAPGGAAWSPPALGACPLRPVPVGSTQAGGHAMLQLGKPAWVGRERGLHMAKGAF